MKLRVFTLLLPLALGLLAAPVAAEAEKVYRIGYLTGTSPTASVAPFVEAFQHQLRELGYVEGQNFVIEDCWAEGQFTRLPDLAAELVSLQVDVIVTVSTPAAKAAMQATRTIPIVMAAAGDPVGSGLVASLARPGGNITGLSIRAPDVTGKQLELLREAVPGLSRVALLWNPANPAFASLIVEEAKDAARALGVQLHPVGARSADEFDHAFAAMTQARVDALLVQASALFVGHHTRLAALAARHRLPAMYGALVHVEAGGLMAYAPNFSDLHRRAATYVDKILKGRNPADLPIEQPITFDLIINLNTAKALGLTIPPTLLFQATKVIR